MDYDFGEYGTQNSSRTLSKNMQLGADADIHMA